MPTRRDLLISSSAILSLAACNQPDYPAVPRTPAPITPEQQKLLASRERMVKKFGGLGAELRVDSFPYQQMKGINLYREDTSFAFHVNYQLSSGSTTAGSVSSMPDFAIPEYARFVHRDHAEWGRDENGGAIFVGTIVAEHRADVGLAIPQALIDYMRANKGFGLRLKFRLREDHLFFRWELESRPGYLTRKNKEVNEYFPPAFMSTGGDFKEARPAHYIETEKDPVLTKLAIETAQAMNSVVIVHGPFTAFPSNLSNYGSSLPKVLLDRGYFVPQGHGGRVWEKGWYVDPKTNQRIEVDF